MASTLPPDNSSDEEESEAVFGRDEESLSDVEFIAEDIDDEAKEAQRELHAGRKRTPAVRFLSNIMCSAVEKSASDIHIEPREGSTLVRIRVDGILRELMTMPSEFQSAVVSRIKILSNMDISERRVPQDGRFLMQHKRPPSRPPNLYLTDTLWGESRHSSSRSALHSHHARSIGIFRTPCRMS